QNGAAPCPFCGLSKPTWCTCRKTDGHPSHSRAPDPALMPTFRYKAISASGETLRGNMEAASEDEVIAKLQDQGHTPLDAAPANGAAGAQSFAWLRRGPFPGEQLALFTHQLATLLGAGQPLDRALTLLLELPEGANARKLIERVRDRVRGGDTLSHALAEEHDV